MNNLSTIKRPKPGDGEEELFRMQEEFLQSHEAPSAKVINLHGQSQRAADLQSTSNKPVSKSTSKFAQRRDYAKISTSRSTGNVVNSNVILNPITQESQDDVVQNLPPIPSNIILGNIVERRFDSTQRIQTPVAKSNSGFPQVFTLSEKENSDTEVSLFRKNLHRNSASSDTSTRRLAQTHGESSSVLIQGSLSSEIHKENMEKLRQMSTQEILNEKAQLESMLSPELIEFIRSRKNASIQSQNIQKPASPSSSVVEMDCHSSSDNCSKIPANSSDDHSECSDATNSNMEIEKCPFPAVSEIVEKSLKSTWLHMDEVEEPKLEWMKDLPQSNLPLDEPYNARFDFEGVLLPFKDEKISIDKGLYHHGEEPDRPGYSLQELLQLCRSATQQQRCTALTTLANIMEKSRKGWYDKTLDPAPLSALNSRNILLLLRFSLDDTSLAVVTSTLQALRAFLYSEADEICLDRLFGWRYEDGTCTVPELLPPKNDVSDVSTLKDHELAQLDSVSAAMRSDLVIRLRYILSELQPTPIAVTASLEILTRLARHSRTIALNIACTANLLEIIVKNFIPVSTYKLMNPSELTNAYGLPNITAVRLCRVLVEYAGRPVADRLGNLRVMNSLLSYVTSEPGEAGLRLSIEALRLWDILWTNNVARDSVSGARLILGSQLQLLLSNHDLASSELASEYAASLVMLCCHEGSLKPTVEILLTKWTTQLEKLENPTWSNTKLVAVTLTALNHISCNLFRSQWIGNGRIFNAMSLRSNLLSDVIPASDRDPSSLPNLGVLTQNGELQPIVSLKSTFLFVSTVVNVLSRNSMINELTMIFNNPDIAKYLKKVSTNDWSLENSWYSRSELFFLSGLIRASGKIELNDLTAGVVLKVAIKLVSSLPADAPEATKDLLGVILSHERVNVASVLAKLNGLHLKENCDDAAIQLPANISAIYEAFISRGDWNQTSLPKDWPYLPLVSVYSTSMSDSSLNQSDTEKIAALLSLEIVMSELVENLSPSLRFSRLILIYFCETVFLNKNVNLLLKQVVGDFLRKHYKTLDFSKDLPGVTSFTDLFTALCENFCANSYGDNGFSSVLLIPVAQRHDKHYRKLLWSEHAGVIRYLRLSPGELMIPMQEYLEPNEDDSSLIEAYLTSLVRGTVKEEWSPVMYKIALHHSAMFLKSNTKLAIKMRSRIGGIADKELARKLLEYNNSTEIL